MAHAHVSIGADIWDSPSQATPDSSALVVFQLCIPPEGEIKQHPSLSSNGTAMDSPPFREAVASRPDQAVCRSALSIQ